MTPGARVAAAIEVLAAWADGREGLDRVLLRWGRAHRFAGSGDRLAIADLVYDALRRPRRAQWLAGGGDPGSALAALDARRLLIGSLALGGTDPAALFTGVGHAPPPLAREETAALARLAEEGAAALLADAPPGLRADMPDWLMPALAPLPDATLDAFGERAPVDLRVNTLKTDREAAMAALAEEGVVTAPGPLAPTCLRVLDGARRVSRSAAYADGLVELQDAASQAAAAHANAAPGMIVLDYCAGGGGKALALAAHMAGRGRLMAHDIDPARMADLPARARRAGAAISPVGTAGLPELADRCDLVFADAPCSGSGAWRRNPDARWRLTPHRLAELHDAQNTVLAGAAACVRPGGTLVYATCSVLHSENIERVRAFLSGNTGWKPEREPLSLLPSGTDGDGFFAIRLVKGVQD